MITKKASLETKLNGEKYLKITFPFTNLTLTQVRSLPDRTYHSYTEPKFWSAPPDKQTIALLKQFGFEIDLEEKAPEGRIKIGLLKPIEIPNTKKQLYPYQNLGVAFIEKKNGRALIADEMGLGKTAQALSWLHLHPEKRPVIIVVPASLKINWQRECEMWLKNPKVQILSGTNSNQKIIGDIFIINYDILFAWVDKLRGIIPKVIILDEIHMIKSGSTRRTKAVKKLCKNITHVIGLSGTPIVNRPIEIYNAVNIIQSDIIPNFLRFTERYCGRHFNGFGWDYNGATNTEELHDLLVSTIMIRRKKVEVLTELPDKTLSFVPMELDNLTEYTKAEKDFILWVKQTKGEEAAIRANSAAALAKIEGLKQLAVQGKLKQVISWITDFLETDEKLVLFATHKFVIDAIMQEFSTVAVKIDGSISQEGRQKAVDHFQNNNKIRLFVGNIQAAGVGISLTAASKVAFIELPWNSGSLAQASDRVHRIGQKENVMVYYLLANKTIEETIAEMLDNKLKVLDSVLDGKETDQSSLLTELMQRYY
ncbi:MAG: DEAD/DEAH box helicase [Candidatus Nanoarchaeia archaeon]|nr:DEAD/DEAH box helicase [Candidatus Nanoarchaeia archaeon]